MADTRRELILARMKSNLDSITGATVYRSRVEPLARGEVPAVIIEPVIDLDVHSQTFRSVSRPVDTITTPTRWPGGPEQPLGFRVQGQDGTPEADLPAAAGHHAAESGFTLAIPE